MALNNNSENGHSPEKYMEWLRSRIKKLSESISTHAEEGDMSDIEDWSNEIILHARSIQDSQDIQAIGRDND